MVWFLRFNKIGKKAMSSYLGHILIREGIINLNQLEVAIREQKQTGRKLGEVLIDLGYTSEYQLVDFLSKEYGFPIINLDGFEIDPPVLKLIPKRTVLKHSLVPINHSGSTLFVAMSDPSDIVTVDDLRFATGYDIKPVVASERAIKKAIEKYYDTEDGLNEQKSEENSVRRLEAEGEIRESSAAPSKWDEFIKEMGKASVETKPEREKEVSRSNTVPSQDSEIVRKEKEEPHPPVPQEEKEGISPSAEQKEETIETGADVSQEADSTAREWVSSKMSDKEESFKPYGFSFYGTNVQEQEEEVGSEEKKEEDLSELTVAPSQEPDSLKREKEADSEAPQEDDIGLYTLLSNEGEPIWEQEGVISRTEQKKASEFGGFNSLECESSSELDSNEPEREEPFNPNDHPPQEGVAPHPSIEEHSIQETIVIHKEDAFSHFAKPGGKEGRVPSDQRAILVIDDSPTIQKIVSITLEQQGYRVLIASDGMQAMAKLNETVPHLIFLDIDLPHMDGYQVCKIIKGNGLTRDIPVIMFSGRDGFFDKVRGRMAGATDYITKPFQPATLLQAVEKHCGERGAKQLHTKSAPFSVTEMNMSDEQRRKNELLAQDEKVLSESEIELDLVLQDSLILVLSKLEQLMVQLEKAYKQPILAIQLLSEIINQVVEFSETLQRADAEAVHLVKALAKGRDTYPMLQLLHTQKNRLSVQTAANLFNGWAGDLRDRQDLFIQICRGMVSIVESYFSLFATYIRSSRLRGHWEETYNVFLCDLNRVMNKIQF